MPGWFLLSPGIIFLYHDCTSVWHTEHKGINSSIGGGSPPWENVQYPNPGIFNNNRYRNKEIIKSFFSLFYSNKKKSKLLSTTSDKLTDQTHAVKDYDVQIDGESLLKINA